LLGKTCPHAPCIPNQLAANTDNRHDNSVQLCENSQKVQHLLFAHVCVRSCPEPDLKTVEMRLEVHRVVAWNFLRSSYSGGCEGGSRGEQVVNGMSNCRKQHCQNSDGKSRRNRLRACGMYQEMFHLRLHSLAKSALPLHEVAVAALDVQLRHHATPCGAGHDALYLWKSVVRVTAVPGWLLQ